MTYEALLNLAQQVTDERSFVRFLGVLREDCESSQHDCESRYENCVEENHWETRSTKNFLRTIEWWSGGDFADGEHGGDPILRRVATMLCVGKHLRHEDMPPRKGKSVPGTPMTGVVHEADRVRDFVASLQRRCCAGRWWQFEDRKDHNRLVRDQS